VTGMRVMFALVLALLALGLTYAIVIGLLRR
jgi:hypothetical protein